MKTLVLVRHSKADNNSEDGSDFKRPLKKKGFMESEDMALKYIEKGLSTDLIISSSATRALQTAKVFAKKLKYAKNNILVENNIYEATSVDYFLNIINAISNEYNTVMLFGHEPTLSGFASFLIRDFNYRFPKTAILAIQFNVNKWNKIKNMDGKNLFFLLPANKNADNYIYY